MRIFLLSKVHRGRYETCCVCDNWKRNVARIHWRTTDIERSATAFVCSGCAREMVRVASEGRKAER